MGNTLNKIFFKQHFYFHAINVFSIKKFHIYIPSNKNNISWVLLFILIVELYLAPIVVVNSFIQMIHIIRLIFIIYLIWHGIKKWDLTLR